MDTKLQEKILLDTLEYYIVDSDNRRCISYNGGCFYNPKGAGKTKKQSEGCAIGRLLSNYHKKKI